MTDSPHALEAEDTKLNDLSSSGALLCEPAKLSEYFPHDTLISDFLWVFSCAENPC